MIGVVYLWHVVIEYRDGLEPAQCAGMAAALPDGMHATVRAQDDDTTVVSVHIYAERWITAQQVATRAAHQALRAVRITPLDIRRVEVIEEDRLPSSDVAPPEPGESRRAQHRREGK